MNATNEFASKDMDDLCFCLSGCDLADEGKWGGGIPVR